MIYFLKPKSQKNNNVIHSHSQPTANKVKKIIFLLLLLPGLAVSQKLDSIKVGVTQLSTFEILDPVTKISSNVFINPKDSLWIYGLVYGEMLIGRYNGQAGFIKEIFIKKNDKVSAYIQRFRDAINAGIANEREKEKQKRIEQLKAFNTYGIAITGYIVTGKDYTGGFDIELFNPTQKTIKYIWITTRPINPVGDLAVASKTVQAVGPIKPLNTASFEFEDIYYSKVIDKIIVSKLKIQYMDGTIKELISTALSKAWSLDK